ncbi:MAG: helicase-related protein [Sulfurovaceae bacterium]|nr:helicase-related protein [Sulfurovaceae bacterium]
MGKKKKNIHIKLNNKIRAFFQGLPFDEGVTTLNEEQLMGLMMLLELPSYSLGKEDMIRALRRIWSEGEARSRETIVSFLTDKPEHKKTSLHFATEKTTNILEILDDIPHTKEEEYNILDSFADVANHKITRNKIYNKLLYGRQKKSFAKLEKALDVTFDAIGRMEFYHSFTFAFKDFDFNKLLLCTSAPMDFEITNDEPSGELLLKLQTIKQDLITKKQKDIDNFLANLKEHGNPYLNEKDIIDSIKTMPPDVSLDHIPISFEKIEKIIRNFNNRYYLTQSTDDFIIQKEKSYAFCERTLRYDISLSYTKKFIYNIIWRGDSLPYQDEFEQLSDRLIEDLNISIDELKDEMLEISDGLKIDEEKAIDFILQFFEPQLISSKTLKLKEKTKRRILYHWHEYIKPFLEKYKQEQLLAKSIRDFKQLFPLARSLKRKIIFHAGPTNSGKTYSALTRLANATTGSYLAPLRLLALEGYENLQRMGVEVSLITGEEEIIHEDSTHISSTIEMMNSSVSVDVCVIDEIQMINDRDRGWAWANALIGAPAKTIILTGSSNALKAVEQLALYLEEPLEVITFERKNPLEILTHPTPIHKIEKQSALVAFSRKDVLSLKQQLTSEYSVSVVYGNLSPEVRREEARRFRDGESDILIATDAIAMGLNLPIKTIIFAKDNKFDGVHRRELEPSEVLQISGRAGRFGFEEKGYIGALDKHTLETISKAFHSPLTDIALPVSVMASLEHVLLIGEILQTGGIVEILDFFAENMEFEGPFVAANIESMLEIATIVDEYKLDLRTKYHLSCAPASLSSPYIESVMHKYIRYIEAGKKVPYTPPKDLPRFAQTNEMLLNAEDRVREISLYLWLSFRFPEYFEDTALAIKSRGRLNSFIETSLKHGHFVKECHRCGKVLDFSYRFSICESCHTKGKRGTRYATNKNKEKVK